MPAMPNGPHAADVLPRVVVRVVQERSARPATEVRVTVAARAALAEPEEQEAVSAHHPAHRAVVRLQERLARGHVQVAVAREADRGLARGGYGQVIRHPWLTVKSASAIDVMTHLLFGKTAIILGI